MKHLVFVSSLLLLFACSKGEKSTQAKVEKNTDTTTMQPPVAFKETPTSKGGNTAGSHAWHYEKKVNKEGQTVYKASITSPKLLEFDFPYNGGSTATLTIRKRENDTHVYIHLSKGQFNRSYQEGKANVRFDKHPPVTYSFSAAENGSANIIFFDSEQQLIDQIKAAQTMVIDVAFAGQGNRQIEFNIANLLWDH